MVATVTTYEFSGNKFIAKKDLVTILTALMGRFYCEVALPQDCEDFIPITALADLMSKIVINGHNNSALLTADIETSLKRWTPSNGDCFLCQLTGKPSSKPFAAEALEKLKNSKSRKLNCLRVVAPELKMSDVLFAIENIGAFSNLFNVIETNIGDFIASESGIVYSESATN